MDTGTFFGVRPSTDVDLSSETPIIVAHAGGDAWRAAIADELRPQIMGENAARLFGLGG